MKPTNATLILQKLKELNAILRNHIEQTKNEVEKLENTTHQQPLGLGFFSTPKVSGASEVAQQWQQYLN